MINTVAIIESGSRAMSLGFVEAGFQVKEVFIKDRKAIEIHRKNIGGKICESGGRSVLEPHQFNENEPPTEAFLSAMLDDLLIHLEK